MYLPSGQFITFQGTCRCLRASNACLVLITEYRLLVKMEEVYAKIRQETSKFNLGDEEVRRCGKQSCRNVHVNIRIVGLEEAV